MKNKSLLFLGSMFLLWIFLGNLTQGCSSSNSSDPSGANPSPVDSGSQNSGSLPPPTGPKTFQSNVYSWDGSWTPAESDFPLPGILDDVYGDGHLNSKGQPTPVLPPGKWDWMNQKDSLAYWRTFSGTTGNLDPLTDDAGHQFGWKLIGIHPDAVDYSGVAGHFYGSSGTDIVNLGSNGMLHSFSGDMGDGPDILVFDKAWSFDFRTGSSLTGGLHDDDLVIAGCHPNADTSFDISAGTIHTGPGNDLIIVRDMDRAAVDAGDGDDGRTDTIDPLDGDDITIFHGNMHDFRSMSGNGKDTVVWYVDEAHQGDLAWLGPSFYGAGAIGDAVWGDHDGPNRLVLVIPEDTVIVDHNPVPPGTLMIRKVVPGLDDQLHIAQGSTKGNPFATHCGPCGVGPKGQKTITFDYHSADAKIRTGFFGVTDFQEVQIGIDDTAKVYRLDETTGGVTLDPSLPIFHPPVVDEKAYCDGVN